MAEPECFLCERGPKWYDQPILESEYGTISSALGAFTDGYILVAPHRHVHAIADLVQPELMGFAVLVEAATAMVRAAYGACIGWEHGGAAGTAPQSSCVRHAHLHLMPKLVDLAVPGPIVGAGSSFGDAFGGALPRPYLLVLSEKGSVTISSDAPRSQYFRRQIAEAIGKIDEWDYLMYPNFDAVRRTKQLLSTRLACVGTG